MGISASQFLRTARPNGESSVRISALASQNGPVLMVDGLQSVASPTFWANSLNDETEWMKGFADTLFQMGGFHLIELLTPVALLSGQEWDQDLMSFEMLISADRVDIWLQGTYSDPHTHLVVPTSGDLVYDLSRPLNEGWEQFLADTSEPPAHPKTSAEDILGSRFYHYYLPWNAFYARTLTLSHYEYLKMWADVVNGDYWDYRRWLDERPVDSIGDFEINEG